MTHPNGRNDARLGAVGAEELAAARDTVHWAVQIAAAAGATLLPVRADFSHTSLSFRPRARALAGEPLGGADRSLRAAVIPEGLRLAVLDPADASSAEMALEGRSIADGLDWLAEVLARRLGTPVRPLVRPEHELPDHPAAHGGALVLPSAAALEELTKRFACADEILGEVAARSPHASPVRCWPHHFDIATLRTLDPGTDPEHARSIGVGLSPGDGAIAEPYFYVTPWPAPKTEVLPVLPDGARWHREGWTGAVLTAGSVAESPTRTEQDARIRQFVAGAIAASETLLGADIR